MSNVILNQIAEQLQNIQNEELWMGQNFAEKFAQINEEEAFTVYKPGMNTIAQIVAHLIAWKEDAILKIRNGIGELMDDHDKNWPDNETLKKLGWKKLQADFEDIHQRIMKELSGKNDQLLQMTYHDQDYKKEFNMNFMLQGLIHHDVYHLGQIGLITRMVKSR